MAKTTEPTKYLHYEDTNPTTLLLTMQQNVTGKHTSHFVCMNHSIWLIQPVWRVWLLLIFMNSKTLEELESSIRERRNPA